MKSSKIVMYFGWVLALIGTANSILIGGPATTTRALIGIGVTIAVGATLWELFIEKS